MTGACVVCKTRLASAKPMPREAGDINDQGGIVVRVASRLKPWYVHSSTVDKLTNSGSDAIDDDILAL